MMLIESPKSLSMSGVMTTDYHDMVNIDTPKEERQRMNIGDIWINAARCRSCGETVRSKNRHDCRQCSCGSLSVDGGSWYVRRNIQPKSSYVDEIVMFSDAG